MSKDIRKFFRIWNRTVAISFSQILAYKGAFFMLILSLFLGDILIPVVSMIIYTVSSGIPGWSLYEFVLFQGTLILVMGFWHTFFASLLGETISAVEEGVFEKILLKPFPSLAFLTANGFDPDGLGEVAAGALIVGFAMYKLQLFGFMLIPYSIFIMLGVLFEYSLTIIASALSFTFVKTWRLFELITAVERFSRYPLQIYGPGMKFFLTFLVPASVAAYWPASVLLGKEPFSIIMIIIVPVLIFFGISLLIWKLSIKKYSSAGG